MLNTNEFLPSSNGTLEILILISPLIDHVNLSRNVSQYSLSMPSGSSGNLGVSYVAIYSFALSSSLENSLIVFELVFDYET